MEIDEFTDTYSDDILYLRDAREALLTHPLRRDIPELCNASLCRVYAILMVGSIEAMLERWLDRDNLEILSVYFARGISNEERVSTLCSAFIEKGINVKKDVFDDYLAIKYIRNAIVHASWETQSGNLKQEQIDWILKREFSADTRKLTSTHWQRFEWVNENLMFYIALTGMANVQPRTDLYNVGVPLRSLPDTSGIIDQSDWPRLYWSNLERISLVIAQNIEKAAMTDEFSWSRGLTIAQLDKMQGHEKKQRFYLSAYAAAKQGFEALKDMNGYADNVVMCWNQFVAHVPEFKALGIPEIEGALKSLHIMHERNIHPRDHIFPPLNEDAPWSVREKLVEACFERVEPLTTREVAEAYALGEKAKRAIPNITPLSLFSIQLPISSPERSREWQEKAQYVADVFEVGQLWYASIEGHSPPHRDIDFYRSMSKTFTNIS